MGTGAGSRYQVLWAQAKGGIGEVYLAQDHELHRRVALKEIQPKHATNPASRQRFVAEAEITGSLEHPGVVPVYGLGTYPDGRPFYAMRFIQGENLATAIHRFHAGSAPNFTGLEFRWLLRKFMDVCNTVAYAHSRGVLHRDLKPSNIMIGPFGETLVMDWGVAKLLAQTADGVVANHEAATSSSEPVMQSRTGKAGVTLTGQAVGTPGYMSPEQTAGKLDVLGPASDVYSLGATLYVLLSDRRPFPGELSIIAEIAPQARVDSPRQIKRRIPPALDAICRRALAPDPEDRYPSALALAGDIERWLADEPVSAWRDPPPDRARRWVRRHQSLVVGWAAAIVVALMALGVAVPLLSLAWRNELAARREEERQRIVALSKARDARINENKAHEEKDRAETALRFLVDTFRKPDPLIDGRALKVVDLLDRAVKDLDRSFSDQPRMKATLLTAIGETFGGLGMHHESFAVFQRALNLRRAQLGDDHPDTLASMNNLAMAYQDGGRFDKAIPVLEETLTRRRRRLGDDNASTIETMNDLAVAYWQAGQTAKAIPLYEETLAKVQAAMGEEHNDTLTIMDNLAVAYGAAGQCERAIALHQSVLAQFKAKLGDLHLTTLVAMNNLARAYQKCGRIDDSIQLYEPTLARLRSKLSEEHPTTLAAMNGLARSYQLTGKLDQAIALFESTLKGQWAKLGSDHPDTLLTSIDLADAYATARQPDKAIALARAFLASIAKNGARLPAKVHEVIPKASELLKRLSEPSGRP
jgi:serine/threonine protein kinase